MGMKWERVENQRHYWTARVGGVNYYLYRWPSKCGWGWEAYAPTFIAASVTDRPYRAAKCDAEAFARRVGKSHEDAAHGD